MCVLSDGAHPPSEGCFINEENWKSLPLIHSGLCISLGTKPTTKASVETPGEGHFMQQPSPLTLADYVFRRVAAAADEHEHGGGVVVLRRAN